MADITSEQRYIINCMLNQGSKPIEIGRFIQKDKSVIYREIKRNSDQRSGVYKSDLAKRKYQKRLKEKANLIKFTSSLKQKIDELLKEDYSPE